MKKSIKKLALGVLSLMLVSQTVAYAAEGFIPEGASVNTGYGTASGYDINLGADSQFITSYSINNANIAGVAIVQIGGTVYPASRYGVGNVKSTQTRTTGTAHQHYWRYNFYQR